LYDARKAIQQRSGSDVPEVEVDLEVEGQKWLIEKRFLRRQLTKLTGPDGRQIEGDEAEQAGNSTPRHPAGRTTCEARFYPKIAVAAHLRRCMTLEMALPFHRIMRLAAGPHLRFLRHHLGEMNCR
jgi:hypothetical protein